MLRVSLGRIQNSWIGALLVLFMVFVLPASRYGGGVAYAQALGLPAPGSSNNNQEPEEHREAEVSVAETRGSRPQKRHAVARRSVVLPIARPPLLRMPVVRAPVIEPSVLSVRRLL